MKWTTKPKMYGWYWWKPEKDIIPEMMYLMYNDTSIIGERPELVAMFPYETSLKYTPIIQLKGYYFGSIEEPKKDTEYEE